MKLPLFQIDAFAEGPFQGNPAAVCPLEDWLPDEVLQAIAEENNLSETAFYVGRDGRYDLRWFTPRKEVDLCGHATLAAGHVIFERDGPALAEISFQSKSGPLTVTRLGPELQLDFPAVFGEPCDPPAALIEGLGLTPIGCQKAMDYLAIFKDEHTIRSLQPDFSNLKNLDLRGVIVTSPGSETDFVSRFFAPKYGIDEDPVTGSAHCALTPYWADQFGVCKLTAQQLSRRTGRLRCEWKGDRVLLSGQTRAYLEGTIDL